MRFKLHIFSWIRQYVTHATEYCGQEGRKIQYEACDVSEEFNASIFIEFKWQELC